MGKSRNTPSGVQEFEASYREHYAAVLSYLRRRSGRDVAEDLCAEVFTRAWRGWPPHGQHLPWLYGIAHNVLLEFYRMRARNQEQEDDLKNLQEGQMATSTEELVVGERSILDALKQLSEADQEVLRLHTWEALSVGEIALALGVTPGSSRVRLHRARKRLLEVLSNQAREDN